MALASLAVAALATPAAHAAGVVVRLPDREARIDEATLRDSVDVPAGTYTLRAKGGAGDAIAHPPAVSLPRLLELAGVAPDALSFVSIRRPNGTLTVLRAPDLARPSPFPEGPPLVWLDADSVRFLRPVRDDADVNGADNIATAGDDLAVRVHQGPLLEVALRVAPSRPRARERVRLEARVTGARARHRVDGALALRRRDRRDRPGRLAPLEERRAPTQSSRPPRATTTPAAHRSRSSSAWVRHANAPALPVAAPAIASDRPPRARPSSRTMRRRSRRPRPMRPRRRVGRHPRLARRRHDRRGPRAGARSPRKQRLRANDADAPAGSVPVRGVLVAARLPAGTAAAPGGAPRPPAGARRGGLPDHRDATLAAGGALACALLALGAWRERRRRHP